MVIAANVSVGKRGVEEWLLIRVGTKAVVVAVDETRNSSSLCAPRCLSLPALAGSPGLARTTSVSDW